MKIFITTFIIIFYCTSYIFSQNEQIKIDSLLKVTTNSTANHDNIEAFFLLSKMHQKIDLNQSAFYNEQLFATATIIKSTKGIGLYHLNNTFLYQAKGLYKKSIEEATKGAAILAKYDDKSFYLDIIYFKAFSLFFLGEENGALKIAVNAATNQTYKNYYQQIGQLIYFIAYYYFCKLDVGLAINHTLIALENYKNSKNQLGIIKCYYNMTDFYIKTNLFYRAKEYGYKTLNLLNDFEKPVKVLVSGTYVFLAQIHIHFKEFDIAKNFTKKAIEINKELKSNEFVGLNLIINAEIEYKKGSYTAILPLAKEIIAISNSSFNLINGYYYLGVYYNKIENYTSAKINLYKAIALIDDDNKLVHRNVYNEIALTEEKIQNFKKATEHLKKFQELETAYLSNEKEYSVIELQTRFDLNEKELEIKNLTIQTQKKTIVLQEKEREKNQLILIIIFCFTLIVFILISLIDVRNKNSILKINNQHLKNVSDEIEKLYTEQSKLLQQIEQSNLTIRKTFSIISHDLRDPYNLLLGYSNFIKDNFEILDTEKLKTYINIINKTAKNNYNFAQQLLTWSLKQQDGIIINKQLHNLNETIDNTIHTLMALAKQKNITIHKKYIATVQANLYFDKDVLFNVTYNIINNAIKYSDINTTIIIRTYQVKENIEIEIKDEGKGIEAGLLAELNSTINLEKFHFKMDGKEYIGGFGLSYVKELIHLHDGKITFTSILGKGTTVKIAIPLKR